MFPTHIDNVMRSTYMHCARKFELRHMRDLVPAQATNIHLHFGACYARGLEVGRKAFYAEGLSEQRALKAALRAAEEMWGDFEVSENQKGYKNLPRLLGAIEFYFARYPMGTDFVKPWVAPDGQHAIEFKFALPIPGISHPETGGPIYYCGRTDFIGEYAKQLFIVDDKTTTSLGEQWARNWELDSQNTGYVWAARSLGYPVAGAILRGLAILSEKFVKETKATLADGTAGQYLPNMSYSTAHAIVQRAPWETDRWLDELRDNIGDMIRDYQRGRYRMALDKDHCNAYGGCPYREACRHENPEPWIEQYFKIEKWSPLNDIVVAEKP